LKCTLEAVVWASGGMRVLTDNVHTGGDLRAYLKSPHKKRNRKMKAIDKLKESIEAVHEAKGLGVLEYFDGVKFIQDLAASIPGLAKHSGESLANFKHTPHVARGAKGHYGGQFDWMYAEHVISGELDYNLGLGSVSPGVIGKLNWVLYVGDGGSSTKGSIKIVDTSHLVNVAMQLRDVIVAGTSRI